MLFERDGDLLRPASNYYCSALSLKDLKFEGFIVTPFAFKILPPFEICCERLFSLECGGLLTPCPPMT